MNLDCAQSKALAQAVAQHASTLKRTAVWLSPATINIAPVGEALRGTDIVFSRKPNPNFLGVDETLDEEAWSTHIRTTLEATRGVSVEFIIRDVYTVHGDLTKPRRAVELARRQIEQHRKF